MPLHIADGRLMLLRRADRGAEAGRARLPRPVAAGDVPAGMTVATPVWLPPAMYAGLRKWKLKEPMGARTRGVGCG